MRLDSWPASGFISDDLAAQGELINDHRPSLGRGRGARGVTEPTSSVPNSTDSSSAAANSAAPIRRTSLHAWHAAHGARLVDFAGWEMPIQYRGIVAEHTACREACALFDVSHMGRLDLSGERTAAWLDSLVTRRVSDMPVGRIRYSLMCRDDSGVLDDILVYRLPTVSGSDQWSLVVNASNREKLLAWMAERGGDGSVVAVNDRTLQTAMIAVQGPKALSIAAQWLGWDPTELSYYTGRIVEHEVGTVTVGRTGYTGEDGVELVVSAEVAEGVWTRLFELGASVGITAAGLGARDTLRLEAGMPLYGHELLETRSAACAGLDFAIQTKDREFVGKAALLAARAMGDQPVRVGLRMLEKRPVREGAAVLKDSAVIGIVTSGTFSPTLQQPIAMAYVDGSSAALGTPLQVDIRGTAYPAEVVGLPFYRRAN